MIRVLRKEGGGILVELDHMQKEEGTAIVTEKGIPSYLRPTVTQYQQVFHMPQGLPTQRGREHAILLGQGHDLTGTLNTKKLK